MLLERTLSSLSGPSYIEIAWRSFDTLRFMDIMWHIMLTYEYLTSFLYAVYRQHVDDRNYP